MQLPKACGIAAGYDASLAEASLFRIDLAFVERHCPAGGRLIEAAGLKGHQTGGVMISPVHANFFVNTGGGMATDYLTLIKLARETVHQQFGVDLELEVELLVGRQKKPDTQRLLFA